MIEAKMVGGIDIHSHNTFENPEAVVENEFKDYTVDGENMKIVLPASSVVEIRVQK